MRLEMREMDTLVGIKLLNDLIKRICIIEFQLFVGIRPFSKRLCPSVSHVFFASWSVCPSANCSVHQSSQYEITKKVIFVVGKA